MRCLASVIVLFLAGSIVIEAAEPENVAKKLPNPFFAFSNGVQGAQFPNPTAQAQVLAELGYAGIGPSGTRGIPEMQKAMDAKGLTVFAQYVGVNLDDNRPKFDPNLPKAIRQLKDRKTFIWLTVHGRQHPRGSEEGDRRAVTRVNEVAELCAASNIRVALYPHTGFYVERVEDAVRIADKVDRPNVGVTFNLCHWLKLDKPESMERLMKLARPRLFLVSINGADRDGKNWNTLIQTLDRGSFDVTQFMRTLHELEYTGPVGLQCYAVKGDKRENLKRSIAAWQKISAQAIR